MKKKYTILLSLLISISCCQFTSCSVDETPGEPIEFTSNIKELLDDENVNSIDILAYKPDNKLLWNMNCASYRYMGDILTTENDYNAVYYTEEEPELYFHAYYPEYSHDNIYRVLIGVSDPKYTKYNDFQFAATEITSSQTVDLHFEHMLSKIRFIFASGIVPQYATVPNVLSAFIFDPKSKAIEAHEDSVENIMIPVEQGEVVAEIILPPQQLNNEGSAAFSGFCTLNAFGVNYPIYLDTPIETKSGYQYDIVIDCMDGGDDDNYTISSVKELKWE